MLEVLLPNPSEIVCDGVDRQASDEGKVGAEEDKGVRFCWQAGETEVAAETGEEPALAGPVPLCPS